MMRVIMADARVKIDVMNVPELVYQLRREMANMLRIAAGRDRNPDVSKRLRELAAMFEVGQTGSAVKD